VRRGKWKLLVDREAKPLWHGIFGKDGERVRLFNLESDDREKADFALEHPELVDELLDEWRSFDDQLLEYPPPPAFSLPGITGGMAD
jgi:hypothetical protein